VEYANTIGQRLILIDGAKLTELMLDNNVGTRLERIVEIKKVDEDFFE
jgi:restriction system protein